MAPMSCVPVSKRRWKSDEDAQCVGTYRDPDDCDMALNPILVALAEEGEGADTGGGNQLDGENGVDLADELVADIDGRLGYGASKLQYGMLASFSAE